MRTGKPGSVGGGALGNFHHFDRDPLEPGVWKPLGHSLPDLAGGLDNLGGIKAAEHGTNLRGIRDDGNHQARGGRVV